MYRRSADNLARLVEALAPIEPYLLGVPPGLPLTFRMKRAAGRPKDLEALAEREALRDECDGEN